MSVRLVRSDPSPEDNPYASAGYGEATAQASGGDWVCITDDANTWRLALVLTDWPQAREASSPYGYAGVFMASHLSERQRDDLWAESLALLAAEGVVTVFLRFPPYRPDVALRAGALTGLEMRHASDTVLVPTPSADSVWMGMAGRARTAVRKAVNAGFVGEVSAASPAAVSGGSEFRRLYDATMARLDAPGHLRFEDAYYEQLVDTIGSCLRIATVRSHGEAVAACLLISDSQFVHYHLSGSDPRGARIGANNLMLWTALSDAADRGHAAMHLGGGTGRGDSLFQFKASFGGDTVPFHVGSAIVDYTRYKLLVDSRAAELGVAPQALTDAGFFPAFRAVPKVLERR